MPTSRRRLACVFAILGLFPPAITMILWTQFGIDASRGSPHLRSVFLTARRLWLTVYMMMAAETTGSAGFWVVLAMSTLGNVALYGLVGAAIATALNSWPRRQRSGHRE